MGLLFVLIPDIVLLLVFMFMVDKVLCVLIIRTGYNNLACNRCTFSQLYVYRTLIVRNCRRLRATIVSRRSLQQVLGDTRTMLSGSLMKYRDYAWCRGVAVWGHISG